MQLLTKRLSSEEVEQRGETIYFRDILSHLTKADRGRFVSIDVETGEYAVNDNSRAASDCLLERSPDRQLWGRRIGYSAEVWFGGCDCEEAVP